MLLNPHVTHRKLSIFACFLLVFPLSFLANSSANSQQTNILENQIIPQIQNEQKNLIREKEIEELNRAKQKEEEKSSQKNKQYDEVCKTANACRIIQDIQIIGAEKFSLKKLYKKFAQNYKNQCFTKFDLDDIRKNIENFYIERGFVVARVYFDFSKLEQGIIIIAVEEGKIASLQITDNSAFNDKFPLRRKLQKSTAFGALEGEVLNIRDIEQGLDQINRLQSQSVQIKLNPASEPSYSDVAIENNISHLTHINFTLDNSGNQRTGRIKQKISLSQDNLIGVNDNIYLNYSRSNEGNKNRYSRSFYSAYSMPLGYYTLGASYSYSEYKITSAGTLIDQIRNFGNSENSNFYVDRVLARAQKFKTSLKFDLDLSDTDNYLEDSYQPVSSYQLSVAGAYLTNIFYFNNGSLYLQPKYNRGLNILGSKKDDYEIKRDRPHSKFDIYGFYAQFNKRLQIQEFPLDYKLTFDSQFSQDTLYGQRRMALGGLHSVRGYNNNVISGDEGYLFRNDLKIPTAKLLGANLMQKLPQYQLFGIKIVPAEILNKTTLGVFFDYGYVRNKVQNYENDEGHMSGAGLGLDYRDKNFSFNITYSRGLQNPKFVQNIDLAPKEKETIYFSFNIDLAIL